MSGVGENRRDGLSKTTIIVEFETHDGRDAEFRALMTDHARRTRNEEPGCLSFDVVEPFEIDGTSVRNRVLLIEVYADDAAIAAHEQNPRLHAVREASKVLIKSRRRLVATRVGDEAEDEGMTPDQLNAANDG